MAFRRRWVGVSSLALAVALSGCASHSPPARDASLSAARGPLVIAHRGASGELPEHTLEAYRRAVEAGADFIEPDLVCTKDGVLIARHENEIGETTDVAAKFPKRRRDKIIDGEAISGWFAEDFTWAEIKTLRAVQRVKTRDQSKNGLFAVPSFREVLELRARLSAERGVEIGVYPETKHPSYHRSIGCPLEDRLVEDLRAFGLDRASAPVFIQSFEVGNLRELRKKTEARLVQLIADPGTEPFDLRGSGRTYGSLLTPEGLRELAATVSGIGPFKQLVVVGPAGADGAPAAPATAAAEMLRPWLSLKARQGMITTDLVERARAAGLVVHPWTLRADAPFLPAFYEGDARREFLLFAELGVDGVFTDHPAEAAAAFRSRVSR